jgi:hypothetical protein
MLTQAQSVLDQSFTASTNGSLFFGVFTFSTPNVQVEQAQTFTVGVPGTLSLVNLQIEQYLAYGQNDFTTPVTVSIRTLSDAYPDSTLASISIPASSIPPNSSSATWVSADFSAASLSLTAGERLAIVVTSTQTESVAGSYSWFNRGTGTGYANGDAVGRSIGDSWFTHSSDFGFQTYMVPVPEPEASELGLLAASTLLVVGWRRRQPQRSRGVVITVDS